MKVPRTRIWATGGLVLLATLVLLWRLGHLQILQGSRYAELSQGNALKTLKVPAPRGTIVDREGRVLAENRPTFSITLTPGRVRDREASLQTLAFLTGKNLAWLKEKIPREKKFSPLIPIPILKKIAPDEVALIRGKISRIQMDGLENFPLDGIDLVQGYERYYPYGEQTGHLLGYTREANPKQLAEWELREPGRVRPGDQLGVKGIEKTFDGALRGYHGTRYALVDARGHEVEPQSLGLDRWFEDVPPVPGKKIQLSLDVRLNQIAYEAFGDRVGALVALDPRNGEILAWVSAPAYHPQDLSGVIPVSLWNSLRDHPDKILLNRPIQAAYPPGSTHKIVTALAALAEGKIDLKERITCHGHYRYGGRNWGCWNRGGHGSLNLAEALKYSCDVFFYRLGERLGPDLLSRYAHLLGLGEKTGVLQDYERSGLIPTSDWKRRMRKAEWKNADNLGNAIGQGYNLVTPLQNALMVARFSNGGFAIRPRILLAATPEPAPKIPWKLKPEQYRALKEALVQVVEGPGGTGKRAKLENIKVGGKTGTAQVVGLERKGRIRGKTEDHAWFVAFAPAERPEIAVAVLVEHGGGGGSVAAPLAKKVLAAYFENQKQP